MKDDTDWYKEDIYEQAEEITRGIANRDFKADKVNNGYPIGTFENMIYANEIYRLKNPEIINELRSK